MMAEFAQRINCGGATAGATSAFMREIMQSSTRVSYDNILALQTFGDEEEETPVSHVMSKVHAVQRHSSPRGWCRLAYGMAAPVEIQYSHT